MNVQNNVYAQSQTAGLVGTSNYGSLMGMSNNLLGNQASYSTAANPALSTGMQSSAVSGYLGSSYANQSYSPTSQVYGTGSFNGLTNSTISGNVQSYQNQYSTGYGTEAYPTSSLTSAYASPYSSLSQYSSPYSSVNPYSTSSVNPYATSYEGTTSSLYGTSAYGTSAYSNPYSANSITNQQEMNNITSVGQQQLSSENSLMSNFNQTITQDPYSNMYSSGSGGGSGS